MKRILCGMVVAAALIPGLSRADTAKSAAATGAEAKQASLKPALDGQQAAEPPGLDVSRMMFDAESIRQVVRYNMPQIQECYEKVLSDSGARLEGRVMLSFVIDTEGRIGDARVVAKKTSLKDDRVHDCVLLMRRWLFPKPGDNRDHPIEYPFDLKVVQR